MKATYLVTGGTGFIGSHIVEALLHKGETVRVFDNFATAPERNLKTLLDLGALEIMQGDLRDAEAVKAAMQRIEIVFHQGALTSVQRSIEDPVMSLETNVNGTQHVLLAALEAGVRRVIYASSSSVYGNASVPVKSEDLPARPLSPYAVQKLTGELLCGVFTRAYGLETVALRYFNVFGPRQNPHSQYAAVIPRFLQAILAGRPPVIFGDGEQTRDFTYIENVVQANLLAAVSKDAVGEAINIGCGETISLNAMLRLLEELTGQRIEAEYSDPRPGDVRHSLADINRARRLLGYLPVVAFREGLERTLAWMRAR
jgi:UDP-N-acetylglucosamine/UDP-N-acetyl-alpha-D-glucosaminouronate 4-epimerase